MTSKSSKKVTVEKPKSKRGTKKSDKVKAPQAIVDKVVSKSKKTFEESSKKAQKTNETPVFLTEEMSKLAKKWASLQRKATNKGEKAPSYNMRNQYEPNTPIQHKVLGWGYILNNVNDRLEVLFEEGVKYLISNYK